MINWLFPIWPIISLFKTPFLLRFTDGFLQITHGNDLGVKKRPLLEFKSSLQSGERINFAVNIENSKNVKRRLYSVNYHTFCIKVFPHIIC